MTRHQKPAAQVHGQHLVEVTVRHRGHQAIAREARGVHDHVHGSDALEERGDVGRLSGIASG